MYDTYFKNKCNIDSQEMFKKHYNNYKPTLDQIKNFDILSLKSSSETANLAELKHNAAETYFYNTLPFRKATFTINPNFISENLNVKKLELQKQSKAHQANNNLFGPVKYRRDYAFVY